MLSRHLHLVRFAKALIPPDLSTSSRERAELARSSGHQANQEAGPTRDHAKIVLLAKSCATAPIRWSMESRTIAWGAERSLLFDLIVFSAWRTCRREVFVSCKLTRRKNHSFIHPTWISSADDFQGCFIYPRSFKLV